MLNGGWCGALTRGGLVDEQQAIDLETTLVRRKRGSDDAGGREPRADQLPQRVLDLVGRQVDRRHEVGEERGAGGREVIAHLGRLRAEAGALGLADRRGAAQPGGVAPQEEGERRGARRRRAVGARGRWRACQRRVAGRRRVAGSARRARGLVGAHELERLLCERFDR